MNSDKLRMMRKQKNITQEQMAHELGYSGKSGYSQLENGKVKMSIDTSVLIKRILNLTECEYVEIFFT